MKRKVFVSGCFDMLHSGHVAFFEEAARHGDLYVGIGSDQTINGLKGRCTINGERERLYMIKSLKYVKDAWINRGSGLMDFEQEIRELRPDIFFINEDGYTPDKQKLCNELGIDLVVSRRIPKAGIPPRSTTALRSECRIPYRLDLAGGWLDQPFVSRFYPGAVLTISIEPDIEFNDRSGMSGSTRKKAVELWHTDVPEGDPHLLAHTLFCVENPPGTDYVSGSQDAIGIVFPGLNRLDYGSGQYWPEKITSVNDPDILDWIENHLWFITLPPREGSFNVLDETHISVLAAKALAKAADDVWEAVLARDITKFGSAFKASFDAQVEMFPLMKSKTVCDTIDAYRKKALGWKLAGAGGGGYLVLVSDKPVEKAIRIRIRRERYEI
jgi:cytidyltransferase-like protein